MKVQCEIYVVLFCYGFYYKKYQKNRMKIIQIALKTLPKNGKIMHSCVYEDKRIVI